MLVRAFENWARFTDNGVWEYPHIYTTLLFTKIMQGVRARLIDDIIYIIRMDGPAYKIDLRMYRPELQDRIIDNLYPILE